MSRREEILKKVSEVPALPTSVTEIIHLVRNPGVDIGELTRRIEYDPGLTSNLLHLANSAYFGCQRAIGSVREAIVRLGLKSLSRMVAAAVADRAVGRAVKGYDLPSGALLEHSVAVAVAAEELARAVRVDPPPEAFTAALLHDIGKVVLGTYVGVNAHEILATGVRENISFEEAEKRILGIDHAEVGAVLLGSWNLPAPIVDVARRHHDPRGPGPSSLLVDLVHVADAIALMEGIGAGADGLQYRLCEEVLAAWNLSVDQVELITCRMLHHVEEMRDLIVKKKPAEGHEAKTGTRKRRDGATTP